MTIKRAILSVYNKIGLIDFARTLTEQGVQLIASGGTAAALREAGLTVQEVSEVTSFPEILEGRIKTLHPAIYGGILSRRTDADAQELAELGWGEIDLVVVNLHPFEKAAAIPDASQQEIVEQIDFGGIALLGAAAMNFAHVTVVCYPADYVTVLAEMRETGEASLETRRKLAARAFARIADHNNAIQAYLARE